jgi:hypothetical protein
MAEQLTFSGETEPVTPGMETYPPDVQEALNVVTGGGVDTDAAQAVMGNMGQIRPSEQQDLIRAGLVKNSDRRSVTMKAEKHVVKVFDIADEDQAIELGKCMDLIGDPTNALEGRRTPPQHLLDMNCTKGFRTLVVLEYWKATKQTKILANQ